VTAPATNNFFFLPMLDNLKNLAGLPGMLAKAREMQERLGPLQQELATRQVSAESENGVVTAIVNGRLELLRVRIDREKLPEPGDDSALESHVVQAVAMAQNKAAMMIKTEMEKLANDMGLPPGMLPG
jgi:nucleoid-associated protein EbfC